MTSVAGPTVADQWGRTSARSVEWSWSARTGTLSRIEWIVTREHPELYGLVEVPPGRERPFGGEAEAQPLGEPGHEVEVEAQAVAQLRAALAQRAEPAVGDDDAEAVHPADHLDTGFALLADAHLDPEVADHEAGVVRRAEHQVGPPAAVSRPIRSTPSLVSSGRSPLRFRGRSRFDGRVPVRVPPS